LLVGFVANVRAAKPVARDSHSGSCNVFDYGARGDGKTLDTAPIQKAIDACAAQGGGAVLLPSGTFLSGTLILDNNITLHISVGAVLLASPRIADFRPFPPADVALIGIDCRISSVEDQSIS
jgi:polygalacturonase